jgi:hypothetical protein
LSLQLIVMAAYVCMNGGLMNGDRSLAILLTAGAAIVRRQLAACEEG